MHGPMNVKLVDHIFHKLYLISLLTHSVSWQQNYTKYMYRFLRNVMFQVICIHVSYTHCIETKGCLFAQSVFRRHTWPNIMTCRVVQSVSVAVKPLQDQTELFMKH
jgi:hypothetical protein